MISNKKFTDLFDKLQVTENNMVSVQGPLITGYSRETFWEKVISKEPVIKYDSQTIAAATKNMIAGIFNQEDNAQIINLILKLAFYVVDGDDARFVYENIVTFEDTNSSPKVNYASNRRKVSLVCNGWFEKLSKTRGSLDGTKLDLFHYLQQPSNDECISYWGPWLATMLLSLKGKVVAEINVSALFHKLRQKYQGLDFNFPAINTGLWVDISRKLKVGCLDEQKKNYLFWAMINVYHDETTSKTVIDLLNLTILPSLRFKNMKLITLIDKFREVYGQTGASVISSFAGTLRSWENYVKMTETYLNPKHMLGSDKLWPYAREFDSSVFMDVSYKENSKFCNILAALIVLHDFEWYSYERIHASKKYTKLINHNSYRNKLDKGDFELCKRVCDYFKTKERELTVKSILQI